MVDPCRSRARHRASRPGLGDRPRLAQSAGGRRDPAADRPVSALAMSSPARAVRSHWCPAEFDGGQACRLVVLGDRNDCSGRVMGEPLSGRVGRGEEVAEGTDLATELSNRRLWPDPGDHDLGGSTEITCSAVESCRRAGCSLGMVTFTILPSSCVSWREGAGRVGRQAVRLRLGRGSGPGRAGGSWPMPRLPLCRRRSSGSHSRSPLMGRRRHRHL